MDIDSSYNELLKKHNELSVKLSASNQQIRDLIHDLEEYFEKDLTDIGWDLLEIYTVQAKLRLKIENLFYERMKSDMRKEEVNDVLKDLQEE